MALVCNGPGFTTLICKKPGFTALVSSELRGLALVCIYCGFLVMLCKEPGLQPRYAMNLDLWPLYVDLSHNHEVYFRKCSIKHICFIFISSCYYDYRSMTRTTKI